MQTADLIARSPVQALAFTIRGGLAAGQVGAVFARAGTGKSAFLVQVALDALLRGTNVLHVSLCHPQAHVRTYYEEILHEFAGAGRYLDRATALSVERHRVIHSCLGRSFGPDDLRALLHTLDQVMEFRPGLVVVDGLDGLDLDVASWTAAAGEAHVRMWLSVRTHRDAGPSADELAERFAAAILLDPSNGQVTLQVLRGDGVSNNTTLTLDPTTLLLQIPSDASTPGASSPAADSCTLYATGAEGAEAAFGALAEKYGMTEVNFTSEGHEHVRTRGARNLADRDLAAGDVSLVYVSKRLNRQWTGDEQMRRVLQLLWQVVSHADQVFVVGSIREDGTVVGGTGWSVELARRWRKEVWVYDQPQALWFTWDGQRWVPGEPTIKSTRIAGTGTRKLTDEGRAAIDGLFQRSFGR